MTLPTAHLLQLHISDARGELSARVGDDVRAVLETAVIEYCRDPAKCSMPVLIGLASYRCPGHARQRFTVAGLRICPQATGARPRFVAVKRAVMLGAQCVLTARSHSMAKRAANALNGYITNREGV